MEQNNPESLFEIQVDHESRKNFKDAARWGNFISIIYLVCFGILAMVLLLAGPFLFSKNVPSDFNGMQLEQSDPMEKLIQMLVAAIFLIYAGMMLLRFSSNCKRGVEMQDQRSFNYGLKGLRNYFIALAVFSIVSIARDIITVVI
jgi:hypothetical protein